MEIGMLGVINFRHSCELDIRAVSLRTNRKERVTKGGDIG
jgi:hypothetical protein